MVGIVCLVESTQFGGFGLVIGNEQAGSLDSMRGRTGQPSHDSSGAGAGQPSSQQIQLGEVRPDSLYAVTVWVKDPAQMQGNGAVRVAIADASGRVEEKWLHSADLDFYITLQPTARGPAAVLLTAPEGTHLPAVGVAFKPIPLCSAKLEPQAAHFGSLSRRTHDRQQGACHHRRPTQLHMGDSAALRVRTDDLRQRRRAPLRAGAWRRRLRRDAEGLPVVPFHISRRPTALGLFRAERYGPRRSA
jgi:hypothetical protein